MTTTTLTLAAFLEARLAEDEAAALAAQDHLAPGAFAVAEDGCLLVDPARVLAEVASKREIMRRARRERGRYEQTGGNLGNPIEAVIAYEMAVRVLAAAYSDHPEYDPSWAVS